jgi:hypothetical protein
MTLRFNRATPADLQPSARMLRKVAEEMTSPCTSGVHHACITAHRACPSPPLYPPVRDTRARGLYGPCACHTKLAQAERAAASHSRVALCKRTSGLPWRFLAPPKKDGLIRAFRQLRLSSRRVLTSVTPDKTCPPHVARRPAGWIPQRDGELVTGQGPGCLAHTNCSEQAPGGCRSGRRCRGTGVRTVRRIVNTLRTGGTAAVGVRCAAPSAVALLAISCR